MCAKEVQAAGIWGRPKKRLSLVPVCLEQPQNTELISPARGESVQIEPTEMKIRNCILWVISTLATAGASARYAELSSGGHSS